jgi:hypothetical protein
MHVSLLLPTRGRIALVQRLLESLIATTSDLRRLELVLYIDEDDPETGDICHPSLSLVKIIGRPGETMGNMNRVCYEASRGRYVMLINDDVIFRTKNWDSRVLQTANIFPDEIALVYGNDLDQGEAVPTFPIVSRRVCELLGGICPSGYRHLHIESHLLDIFRQLSRLGHKRICYMEDVIFEHMHYVVGKSALDATYVKKNQRLDDLLFIALDEERAFAAKILARTIEDGVRGHFTGVKHEMMAAGDVNPKSGLVARIKRMLLSM